MLLYPSDSKVLPVLIVGTLSRVGRRRRVYLFKLVEVLVKLSMDACIQGLNTAAEPLVSFAYLPSLGDTNAFKISTCQEMRQLI